MKKLMLLHFLFINLFSICFSQNPQIDSLVNLLKNDKADTNKVLHLNDLFDELINNGEYEKAITSAEKAQELAHSLNYKYGEGMSYNNLGIVYYYKSNYPKTLDYYFKALKIDEEIGDKTGIAIRTANIGMVYADQGDYEHAIENISKALKMNEQIGRKLGVAKCTSHLGLVYKYQKNYAKAIEYYAKALKLYETDQNKKGVAATLGNIGNIYYEQGDFTAALNYYFKAVDIYKQIGSIQDIVLNIGNIGAVYMEQKKYKEAEEQLLNALHFSDSLGLIYFQKDNHQNLSQLYEKTTQPLKALEHYKAFIVARDSIYNEANTKNLVRTEMNFEFDKKQALEKAEQDKKDAVATADKKRQKLFLLFIALLAIAIAIIAAVIFRGLQQSKKAKRLIELQRDEITEQKEVVEHQKLLVEEHQKEIVDSITYAKRIQYTLLANKKLLEKNLPEHFVLFKPKDIVSGDFYWATEKSWQSTINKEEKIKRFYIAACDSTGHGVPGAFMSLLNISFLNEAVNEKNIVEPHEILDHVRKRLIENMDGGQDGMDCILVCIENSSFENGFNSPLKREAGGIKITYAAANNSPTIIKNGQLISLDTDKMPVGKGEKTAPFTLHTIDLTPSPVERAGVRFLYLYTDGYADQFGGPKGKKFKYKQLDELLVSISNLSSDVQYEILNKKFENWKGNLEQVDDMLVIGIKI